MIKGLLDLCALSLLAKKERYGYELAEVLANKTDSSIGTIYPILRKMKDAGLVTTPSCPKIAVAHPENITSLPRRVRGSTKAKKTWIDLSNGVNGIVEE